MICKHHSENPEGSPWPVEVSLDHFDNCLDQEARLTVWRMTRQIADQGGRCLALDHASSLARLNDLLRRPHRRAARTAYRARARRRTRRNR